MLQSITMITIWTSISQVYDFDSYFHKYSFFFLTSRHVIILSRVSRVSGTLRPIQFVLGVPQPENNLETVDIISEMGGYYGR